MNKKTKLRWLMTGIISGAILTIMLIWMIGIPLGVVCGVNYYLEK